MFNTSLKTPQALVTSTSSRDRVPKHDQASVSKVIICLFVPSESNLSLVLKITSGDVTTIKHKQFDLSSQEEVMRHRSQDSVQNQRPPSPQHTRPLNKELSPAEIYGAGPQVKSTPGTSISSENQHLVEKDFASQGSLESSTNFNL